MFSYQIINQLRNNVILQCETITQSMKESNCLKQPNTTNNHKQFKEAIDQEPAVHVLLWQGKGRQRGRVSDGLIDMRWVCFHESTHLQLRLCHRRRHSFRHPAAHPSDLFSKTWRAGLLTQSTSSNYLLYSSVESIKTQGDYSNLLQVCRL